MRYRSGRTALKRGSFSEKRAPLLYQLCLQLKEEGFERVDLPVLTKEGNCLSVYRDGTHYLLKHWFTGRECDVRKETEVLQSVRNLARLHQVMFWRDGNSIVGKGQTEQRDETDEAKTEMGSGIENEWNRAIFSGTGLRRKSEGRLSAAQPGTEKGKGVHSMQKPER